MNTPEPPKRPVVDTVTDPQRAEILESAHQDAELDPRKAGAIAETIPSPEGMPIGSDTRRGWLMFGCFVLGEVAFVAASVLVLLPYALASPRDAAEGSLPTAALVVALVVPTVLAALVATTGAALLGQGNVTQRLRSQLSVRWRLSDVGIGLLLGFVGLVITVPAAGLWARWVGTSQANSAVGEAFEDLRLPLGMALVLFFAVWLVAPLCEELLYRGVLWRAMEYWQWNRWVIFVLTTALFSVAHLELLRTPLLVVISLPIALARMLTGNLLASIVAHQANNFLPAIGLLLITQGLVPG
ncbi:MAG: lysostaphin resistance A-like protein [Pseudonocardiaceae bacterium]